MPIYTYKCGKCNQTFDRLEKVISKEEELKCPRCGNKKVEKQFSTFSVGKSTGESSTPACPTGTCNLD